jgi:hypothetical protein
MCAAAHLTRPAPAGRLRRTGRELSSTRPYSCVEFASDPVGGHSGVAVLPPLAEPLQAAREASRLQEPGSSYDERHGGAQGNLRGGL